MSGQNMQHVFEGLQGYVIEKTYPALSINGAVCNRLGLNYVLLLVPNNIECILWGSQLVLRDMQRPEGSNTRLSVIPREIW